MLNVRKRAMGAGYRRTAPFPQALASDPEEAHIRQRIADGFGQWI